MLIASADALPALKERASHGEGELIAFSDASFRSTLRTEGLDTETAASAAALVSTLPP